MNVLTTSQVYLHTFCFFYFILNEIFHDETIYFHILDSDLLYVRVSSKLLINHTYLLFNYYYFYLLFKTNYQIIIYVGTWIRYFISNIMFFVHLICDKNKILVHLFYICMRYIMAIVNNSSYCIFLQHYIILF